MQQREVEIVNKLGLHARASAKLTQLAGGFQCEIWLSRNGRRVNAKSIMGVMMLAAAKGSKVAIETSGADAINLAPDVIDGFSGIGSYSGFFDLAGLGLAAGADGLLRLEFSEIYKDFALDVVEGRWVSGSLTFDVTAGAVPEPGSAALALLALGGLWIATRRPRHY